MRRVSLVGLLVSGALAAGAQQVGGVIVEPCSGPRPTPPSGVTYDVTEGKPVPTMMGVLCLPAGETLSVGNIDWGDGTTGPATVRYEADAGDGYHQAWIEGRHSYPRATCARPCSAVHAISVAATDDQTGQQFPLSARIMVTPGYDEVSHVAIRARAGKRFRGIVTRIRAGGLRFRREFSARIDWGDGSTSHGSIRGRDRTFVVIAGHRWRRGGTYGVEISVRDRFAEQTAYAIANVPVAGARGG